MLNRLSRLYVNAFAKKRWRNIGNFCNRKIHPMSFPYRRYRRGKNRCSYCGGKIGKIKCVYRSGKEMLIDNIFSSNPVLDLLKKKVEV